MHHRTLARRLIHEPRNEKQLCFEGWTEHCGHQFVTFSTSDKHHIDATRIEIFQLLEAAGWIHTKLMTGDNFVKVSYLLPQTDREYHFFTDWQVVEWNALPIPSVDVDIPPFGRATLACSKKDSYSLTIDDWKVNSMHIKGAVHKDPEGKAFYPRLSRLNDEDRRPVTESIKNKVQAACNPLLEQYIKDNPDLGLQGHFYHHQKIANTVEKEHRYNFMVALVTRYEHRFRQSLANPF